MAVILQYAAPHLPWNKGKLVGQKPPLKPREVWAIRVRLQIAIHSTVPVGTVGIQPLGRNPHYPIG